MHPVDASDFSEAESGIVTEDAFVLVHPFEYLELE